LKLDAGEKYNIVVYSYNSSIEPPKVSNINDQIPYEYSEEKTDQFLYQKISNYVPNYDENHLDIVLKHKFMQVRFIFEKSEYYEICYDYDDDCMKRLDAIAYMPGDFEYSYKTAGTISVNSGVPNINSDEERLYIRIGEDIFIPYSNDNYITSPSYRYFRYLGKDTDYLNYCFVDTLVQINHFPCNPDYQDGYISPVLPSRHGTKITYKINKGIPPPLIFAFPTDCYFKPNGSCYDLICEKDTINIKGFLSSQFDSEKHYVHISYEKTADDCNEMGEIYYIHKNIISTNLDISSDNKWTYTAKYNTKSDFIEFDEHASITFSIRDKKTDNIISSAVPVQLHILYSPYSPYCH